MRTGDSGGLLSVAPTGFQNKSPRVSFILALMGFQNEGPSRTRPSSSYMKDYHGRGRVTIWNCTASCSFALHRVAFMLYYSVLVVAVSLRCGITGNALRCTASASIVEMRIPPKC